MNTKTLLLGAVAVAALASPASASHFQGWYVGLEGGASWVQDVDADASKTTFSTTDFTAKLNTGWAVIGTVGYAFPSNLRVEFEAGYRDNDISTFTVAGIAVSTPANDSANEFTLMANVLYDVPLTSKLALTLGAGLGGDELTVSIAANNSFDASNWTLAYQGIAGVSYAVSPGLDLTMTYRYLGVSETTLTDAAAFTPVITTDNIAKHTLSIGLRFDLQADAPPP